MDDRTTRPPKAPLAVANLFDPFKLLSWRLKRNLTQTQLAERLGMACPDQIKSWENALFRSKPVMPSRRRLSELAAALDILPGLLLSSKDELELSLLAHDQFRRERKASYRATGHPTRAIWKEIVLRTRREIENEHGRYPGEVDADDEA